MAADGGTPVAGDYRAYTRAFDRIVAGRDLSSVLGRMSAQGQRSLDQAWETFQTELLDWKTRAHLAALGRADEVRAVQNTEQLRDCVVALLVDQSGSMRGQSMLLAAAAVDVAQDFLGRLGCKVEVLGFTTVSWRGGRARRRWLWRLRPKAPGRLCELLHVVYRSADEVTGGAGSESFRAMLRPDLPKENVDGEALEWAASRLRARREARKILIVISDGAPVDDSTLMSNDPGILDRHLRAVIRDLGQAGDIELAAIGVGHEVNGYYANASKVEAARDLGGELTAVIARVLRREPAGGEPDMTKD